MQISGYLVRWSTLRRSLGRRAGEYLRETSIPVVPYFIDPARSIRQRLAWLVVFVALEIAVFGTIKSIWDRFQTSPTMTYLYIERKDTPVDFPNVYLCFDESHLDFSNISTTTLVSEEALRAVYTQQRWQDLGDDVDEKLEVGLADIYRRASPECGQHFTGCRFGTKQLNCDSAFGNDKIATPAGICCEFKSRALEKSDPSWELKFQSDKYPFSVLLTGKDEGPPIYGQQPVAVVLTPSSVDLSVDITTTASNVRFLSQHQRKCVFPDEGPSHVVCERLRVVAGMRALCNCLPWFYARPESRREECSSLAGYKCVSNIRPAQFADKSCYLSCEHTAYNVEKIERGGAGLRGVSSVRLLAWPDVRYQRVTRFGWLDLLVAFGGVAGFFIGYSAVSNVELLYYFTLRTYCGAVLETPKTRFNVQTRHK